MRILAVLLFCSLPFAAAGQTADYARLIDKRLAAFERELRALNGVVEQLRYRLDGLEKRVETLESARPDPAPDAAPPTAAAPGGAASSTAAQGGAGEAAGALPADGDALALYQDGRKLLLQARLPDAEGVFADFLQRFPEHELANNARHWLAASLAGQGKHGPAAQQFLLAYEKAPEGPKAPDNLLKLARALAALDKREEACIALSRLARKHKDAPQPVTAAAEVEGRQLQC